MPAAFPNPLKTHSFPKARPVASAPGDSCRREGRREGDIPEVSAWDEDVLEVDPDAKEMLTRSDLGVLSSLQVTHPPVGINFKTPRGAGGIYLLCFNISI